jgi:hypothetical protein
MLGMGPCFPSSLLRFTPASSLSSGVDSCHGLGILKVSRWNASGWLQTLALNHQNRIDTGQDRFSTETASGDHVGTKLLQPVSQIFGDKSQKTWFGELSDHEFVSIPQGVDDHDSSYMFDHGVHETGVHE